MKFANGDKVRFYNTSDSELDSITGTVVGIFLEDALGANYTVLLDRKYPKSDWDAITITEHCLTHARG